MEVLQHEHPLTLIDLNSEYPRDEVVYDDEQELIMKQDFRCPCGRCGQEINFYHRYTSWNTSPQRNQPRAHHKVQQICLYMHDPREPHLAALKRILRYVQGTLDLDLHLYPPSTISLVGYTDADWAGCPSTRRSTSGYCVFLGDNLLYRSAKRQHTLSRSSAEAEYRGVANVVAETAWLSNLSRDLALSFNSTATL
ncbi:ribonuclease H-like domain-containing protein [Tanacetum coccineum]